MTNKILSQSRAKVKEITPSEVLSALAKYYKVPANKVIQHLYERYNYNYADIAKLLGTSRQNVAITYPKNKEVSK